MIKITKDIKTYLFLATMILVVVPILTGWAGIERDSTYSFSFITLFAMYFCYLYDSRHDKMSYSKIITLFLIFFLLVWTVFNFQFNTGENEPFAIYTFAGCLVIYHISINWSPSDTVMRGVCLITFVAGIVFIYLFQTEANSWYGVALTLQNVNPQGIGAWALIFFCYGLIFFDYVENPVLKILAIGGMAYFEWICWKTDAKSAIYASIIILLLRFWPIKQIMQSKLIAWLVAGIPMLITYFGVFLYYLIFSKGVPSLFTGRERGWASYLKLAGENPLMGMYAQYGSIYTHNIYVEHVLFWGYPMAIVFVVVTAYVILNHLKQVKKIISYDCYIAFIACLLMGSMENSVFSTGVGGLFVYACFLPALMNYDGKRNLPIEESRKSNKALAIIK